MKKVPVEVYSRVVGYFRPVNHWNKGKQEEFNHRKEFDANNYFSKELQKETETV